MTIYLAGLGLTFSLRKSPKFATENILHFKAICRLANAGHSLFLWYLAHAYGSKGVKAFFFCKL